jgi:uncharacterized membrane protein YesL
MAFTGAWEVYFSCPVATTCIIDVDSSLTIFSLGGKMKAFTVMGRTIKAVYDELFLCVYLSVLWWIGTVLIITAAPATLGLHRVANRMANYQRVESSFFFEAARSNFFKGWLLYLIRVGIPVLIGVNVWFYVNMEGWMWLVGVFFVWLLLATVMVGLYLFPLFWQQDEQNLVMVLRNAAILTLQHPIYTILLLLFIGVVAALSVIPIVLIFLTPAIIAVTANFGLAGILQEMDMAPQPPEVSSRR